MKAPKMSKERNASKKVGNHCLRGTKVHGILIAKREMSDNYSEQIRVSILNSTRQSKSYRTVCLCGIVLYHFLKLLKCAFKVLETILYSQITISLVQF